jgi:hypothetical protein
MSFRQNSCIINELAIDTFDLAWVQAASHFGTNHLKMVQFLQSNIGLPDHGQVYLVI